MSSVPNDLYCQMSFLARALVRANCNRQYVSVNSNFLVELRASNQAPPPLSLTKGAILAQKRIYCLLSPTHQVHILPKNIHMTLFLVKRINFHHFLLTVGSPPTTAAHHPHKQIHLLLCDNALKAIHS